MGLDLIVSGRVARPRRVLLYGTHGIGKTTLGAATDSPIFIPTEDGLAEIDAPRFPLCDSLAACNSAIAALSSQPHDFKTVVLDSADWLERLIWQEVAKAERTSSIDAIPYGKGFGMARDRFAQVLASLDGLRNSRGMGVLLIAHASIERFQNPETDPYDRFAPKLNKHASALLQEWADEVLFCSYKVMTRTSGEGFNRRTKGIGSGERVIYAEERPGHVAKSRCGLRPEIPFDQDLIAAIVRGDAIQFQDEE
jgi:hypothetical protein